MEIIYHRINVNTDPGINIYNLTPQVKELLTESNIQDGQALVFSRHTTTALAINEYEERLLEDIRIYLKRLAPPSGHYLHNDLHLRDVPKDEPINAHSHLMAITLSTSEIIPIVEGKMGLGTYQSILFFDLDGPRQRQVSVQLWGQ